MKIEKNKYLVTETFKLDKETHFNTFVIEGENFSEVIKEAEKNNTFILETEGLSKQIIQITIIN